jgi:hypothetical protein
MSAQPNNLHPVFAGIFANFADQPMQLRRAAYVSALRRHDWTHEHSESLQRVREGREQLEQLVHEQQQIDPGFELWNRNCPEQCKNGARYGV